MKKRIFSMGVAVLFFFCVAQAANPPDVKEGLWSSQTQTVDNPGNRSIGGCGNYLP